MGRNGRGKPAPARERGRGTGLFLPVPVGELFAEGDFFEFADGGAGNGVDEDEGVGELPLGEGLREEGAQLFGGGANTIFQDDRGKWPLLPFRVRNADYTGFLD